MSGNQWIQLISLLCLSKAEIKVSAELSGCSGREYASRIWFQNMVHSGCWQNSVPCGCRTEVTISLLAVSWGPAILFLEATRSATYTSHMVQSLWANSLSHFKLLWADLPFCYISLIPVRKSSLILRSQELDWVHLDILEYFLYFKVFNLNYICKDPFAT